jgi:acetoacetate decarboxylase
MFQFDPDASYTMPAHFGARRFEPGASGWYHDVTAMTIRYLTDRERLATHLPEPFSVADEPVVTVFYARNRDVDWLAGHGYNMIGVTAAAIYDGPTERLTGSFTLVIWENLPDPILSGRELQGIPKIYAEIPDHSVDADGVWHAGAAHFGHQIVDLSIGGLRPPTDQEIDAAEGDQAANDNPMGWRYFPCVSGIGTAVSEPTTFPSENVFTSAQIGTGAIEWQRLTWEQNPTQYRIANALADLPIVEYLPAIITTGSTNLFIPTRIPRTLA